MRYLALSLGVLVTLVLVGPLTLAAQEATPAAAPAAGTRTDVRYFLPFGPDGLNESLTAATTEPGVCGYQSLAAPGRPDAWDCLSDGGTVYDPCFANPFAPPDEPGELACLASPFATEVVLLAVNEPLPRQKEPPQTPADGVQEADPEPWDHPWALELANGEQCTQLSVIEVVLAGQAVHYECAEGGSILGAVDRDQAVWTVSYLAEGEVATTLVDVTVAWI